MTSMRLQAICSCLIISILAFAASPAAPVDRPPYRIETNVVYGMYSGLALLMDVHRPDDTNGVGVILILGSGWNAWLNYGARQLKNYDDQLDIFLPPLLDAGYTVFVINYRSTPRFAHPAQVEDAQRAVRFIRHHADTYGIDGNRIGAVGVSTGAHLVAMLGVIDPSGLMNSMDPVNHIDASVQCVIAFSTPTDFISLPQGMPWQNVALLTGVLGDPDRGWQKGSDEYHMLEEASPLYHVSPTSAPTLLVHGELDKDIPIQQARVLEEAMRAAKVQVELITVPGTHTFYKFAANRPAGVPDFFAEMNKWLHRWLQEQPSD